MKTEFELQLNDNGHPIISFKHHHKDRCLEQQVLKVFIKMATENGLRLLPKDGMLGGGKCWERYEISPEKEKPKAK